MAATVTAPAASRTADFLPVLGPAAGITLVVGTVIGSGIFAVPQQVAKSLGGYGFAAILGVWIFCGLLSLAGALCYAELGAMLPRSGGQYVYLREAYGPLWGFLYGWMEFWIARSGGIAAVAVVFARYLDGLVHVSAWTGKANAEAGLAVAAVAVLSVINYLGVRWGAAVQVLFTTLKVAALVGIVAVGFLSPTRDFSHWSWPAGGVDASFFTSFGVAMIAVLWAYDGWTNGTTVAEEMRRPQRNIPLSLIVGTLVVTVVYVTANMAYHLLLPVDAIRGTDRVAATAMGLALGGVGASAISVAVMISTFGSVNGSLLSGARIFHAMARDRVFFTRMGELHPRYRTPDAAILTQGVWAVLLIVAASQLRTKEPLYDMLFTYAMFASWLFYGMSAAAVIVLRRRRPEAERPYRVWGYPVVPALFVLVAVGFVANTLVDKRTESLIGLGIIALGVPAYQAWRRGGVAIGAPPPA